jgi:antitoxin Phd
MPRHGTTGRTVALSVRRVTHPPWKLEDAKARFSEVVRRARTEGPQRVTVRGKDAVVVIAVEALEKLLPPRKSRQDLVGFLQGLDLAGLDVTRERDTGRDVKL